MNRPASSSSSDPPLTYVEMLKRDKASADREVARLQRELELVKGKAEGKVQSLEETLERSNLTLNQLRGELEKISLDRARIEEESSLLQDKLIDQESEISTLKTRQRLIDAELARKDKDAKQLLACVRRYKSRLDYMRSKLRRHTRRTSKSGEEENGQNSTLGGASVEDGGASPFNGSILTGTSSVLGGRRDSIPFPGYMTAEEEYFRLVVLAAKLNVAGTTTPSTVVSGGEEQAESLISASQMMDSTMIDEVNEADIDARIMYERVQAEKIPFHKWHEWAQDYCVSHHMPALMGVMDGTSERKPKRQGFARRVVSGSTRKLKALAKMIPIGRNKKRNSIGIAAGGNGIA